MSKLGLSVNSVRPLVYGQKAVQSICSHWQKCFATPTGYRFMPQLKEDVVSFTTKDPNEIYKEINNLGISKLRRLDVKTYSGETLEGKPEILQKLKNFGIETVVDFRSEGGKNYQNECESAGLEYFRFPLNHTQNFTKDVNINDDFVQKLKKLFDTFNRGNAYLGCKWGIDRTNLGLMLNYLLNPMEHLAPEIVAWGGENEKSIVNKSKKITENILKQLNKEQKETLGLDASSSEVLRQRARRLVNKYKANW